MADAAAYAAGDRANGLGNGGAEPVVRTRGGRAHAAHPDQAAARRTDQARECGGVWSRDFGRWFCGAVGGREPANRNTGPVHAALVFVRVYAAEAAFAALHH